MSLAHFSATSPAFVTIEQLNHAQWEASCPSGAWRSSGATSYVHAFTIALWMACKLGLGVETVDLAGQRLTMQWPERVA